MYCILFNNYFKEVFLLEMIMLKLHPADWWTPENNSSCRCLVCPRKCLVYPGKTGFCKVRTNIDGKMFSRAYGYPTALQIDTIEKKPLRHFRPGTAAFSVGGYGCNLYCVFCQNNHLSRVCYQEKLHYRYYTPESLIQLVLNQKSECIAFTYNEPAVWSEYIRDCAIEAHKHGLSTILVSNAYFSEETAADVFPLFDAANIDVKGFTEDFYQSMCKASLEPVKRSCEYYKNVVHGHLELTNLVIPGKNDSLEMIDSFLDWVETKLGIETPIHFTAYHPAFEYHESPKTPISLIQKIRIHALRRGFPNVYLGNIC